MKASKNLNRTAADLYHDLASVGYYQSDWARETERTRAAISYWINGSRVPREPSWLMAVAAYERMMAARAELVSR